MWVGVSGFGVVCRRCPDKHRRREIDGPGRHNHRTCPEDGFDLRNMENVRGVLDVGIEHAD